MGMFSLLPGHFLCGSFSTDCSAQKNFTLESAIPEGQILNWETLAGQILDVQCVSCQRALVAFHLVAQLFHQGLGERKEMHLDMVVFGNLHHDIKDKYSTCINLNMAGLPRMSSILVMLQWGCAAYCLHTFFVQFQHGLQCSEELHIGECNARRTNTQLAGQILDVQCVLC